MHLGIRHEFTTGWNEGFGRASNYLLDSSNVLITNPRVANSVYTQNNAKWLFSPASAWPGTFSGMAERRCAPALAPTIP